MLVARCQQEAFLQVRSAWKMRHREMCVYGLSAKLKQILPGTNLWEDEFASNQSGVENAEACFFFFFNSSFCFAWTKQLWNTMQILTHLKCWIKIPLSERLGVFFLLYTRNTKAWCLLAWGRWKAPETSIGNECWKCDFILLSTVHCCN